VPRATGRGWADGVADALLRARMERTICCSSGDIAERLWTLELAVFAEAALVVAGHGVPILGAGVGDFGTRRVGMVVSWQEVERGLWCRSFSDFCRGCAARRAFVRRGWPHAPRDEDRRRVA